MTMAGICLGVAAIVSISIINHSVLVSFDQTFTHATGRSQLQITNSQSGIPESILETVQQLPEIEYAAPILENDGQLSSGLEQTVLILGVDVLLDTQLRDYSLAGETAEIPDPILFLAKPDSILITKMMAEREGLRQDQRVNIQTVHGERAFRVRGILNPTGPARAMGGNVIIMDIYAAQMAFGKEGRFDRIDIRLRQGQRTEDITRKLLSILPAGYVIDTPASRTRQMEAMLEKFQNSFHLVSFLAIFAGMYLIYNAVSISIVQRTEEIGILRAMGASRSDIRMLFFGEVTVLAIVASAAGVAGGIALAWGLVDTFESIISAYYVRTRVEAIAISWLHPTLGFGLGMFASLAAAFVPANASSRTPPMTAIRNHPYATTGSKQSHILNSLAGLCLGLAMALLTIGNWYQASLLSYHVTILCSAQLLLAVGFSLLSHGSLTVVGNVFSPILTRFFGSEGTLAAKNMHSNVTRNAVAVAAIFFGITVFVSASGLVQSVRHSALHWLDNVARADILLTTGHPGSSVNAPTVAMPMTMLRELEATPGVLSVDPWRKMHMNYGERDVLLSAVDVIKRLEYSQFVYAKGGNADARTLLPNHNRILINEPFAKNFEIHPGDAIDLPTPFGNVSFEVAGIVVDYLSDTGTIIMDINTLQKHWNNSLADSFSIRITPDADLDIVRRTIQNQFGHKRKLFVLSARKFRTEIIKTLDSMFIFNHILNIITALIAGLGIVITLLSSVSERRHDIGVLRSLGMLRSQIASMVMMESLLLGLTGGFLGSVAGSVAGWINLEFFFVTNYGSAARYVVPFPAIGLALFLSVGVAGLAGIIPAYRASQLHIVEALARD